MVIDLVCGMEVDEKTTKYKTEYMGKTFYFCSPGCKTAFEKNPMKYMGKTHSGSMSHHSGCC